MINWEKIIQNIGLIAASLTALYGINAWRREFRGKKEYELAEEVLTLFYDCRDRLRAIRSPLSHGDEGSSRKTDPDETEEETKFLNRAYVVFERYEKNREAFSKLFALRYRFAALFGVEAAQPIEDFRLALNEIFISAEELPDYWMRQGRVKMDDAKLKEHLKEMHEHQRILWGSLSKKDVFNTKIEEIITQMENACSNILRPKSLWQRIRQ